MDLSTIIQTAVGIILIIFIPGISLTLALFPKKEELDLVERTGLGLILGLTPIFLLYFGDKNFSIPINTVTSLSTIVLVSVIGIIVWQFRKKKQQGI